MQITKDYLESLAEDINPEKVFLLDPYQRGRLHMVLDLIRLLEVHEEKHDQEQ